MRVTRSLPTRLATFVVLLSVGWASAALADTPCQTFPTTYDLIQQAVFENHSCTSDLCHGSAKSGGLDLRADVSYQNLVDMPAETVPGWNRVEPGSKDRSLLWINLAALTLPDQFHAPLRGMPVSAAPLSANELEAMRLWIEDGGASRTAVVDGTANLLSGCLPTPAPAEVPSLPTPVPGEGVQMHMPALTLAPHSEQEVCFSTYYDFTGQIPASALSPDGTKFYYKKVDIRQDPVSHHLIINIFNGTQAADDPAWGPYSCAGGPQAGQSCDPLNLAFCGDGGECATKPYPTAACIGFGPQNSLNALTNGSFVFAQSPAAEFLFPDGVYNEIPVKGVLLWDSHAFDLTNDSARMEAWINIYFAKPSDQQYESQQIFNASKIFWADHVFSFPLPSLPPFQDREVCQIHTFGRAGEPFVDSIVQPNQTVHLFELSGHMHEHGKRFRIFRGHFRCKGGAQAGQPCSGLNPEMCPSGTCTDDGGRDPQASLLYENLVYNDPVIVRPDPPIEISGAAPIADRSLTFCGHWDNGLAPNIEGVKRRSTSAPAASVDFHGVGLSVGGPCAGSATRCIGGPHHNELCSQKDANCDSSPGAGDGDCDACPLTGGMRTTDEMFILFGNYWLDPQISTPVPTVVPTATPTPSRSCTGDCNNDQTVTIDEMLTLVNIALGTANRSACTAADANNDGQITIDEILAAVNNSLNGCGG